MTLANMLRGIEKRKQEICREQEKINKNYHANSFRMTDKEKIDARMKLTRLTGEMQGLTHVIDLMIEEVGRRK